MHSEELVALESLTVAFGGLEGVTDPGRDQFRLELERFSADLIQEAGRLESGERATSGPVEITARHLLLASEVVRRPVVLPTPDRKVWPDRFTVVLSPVSGVAAGVLGSYLTLGWGQALAFGIAATVSVVSTIWAIARTK